MQGGNEACPTTQKQEETDNRNMEDETATEYTANPGETQLKQTSHKEKDGMKPV